MKMSRRAARMEKHHKRKQGALGINLVSLMDIFTILVFFLLVNSSDGEVLPTHRSVDLPESVSEEQPRQTVVVMINTDNVLLHGEIIAPVKAVM
ncbi:MAG: biopolymer transporter ExbD, partial [Gammaproteobacteria bacterium]|nr:biopolymer transporter ExbD [Gammaproteobacteria bacterium]